MAICLLKDCLPSFSSAPDTKDGKKTVYSVAPCGRIGGCNGPSVAELEEHDRSVGGQSGIHPDYPLRYSSADGFFRPFTNSRDQREPRNFPPLSELRRE